MEEKNNKKKFRKHFRKGPKETKHHPAYVYDNPGKDYKYVSLTHAEFTDGARNKPLKKNPNPNDNKPAYVQNKTFQSPKKNFGGKKRGWSLKKEDNKEVEKIINNPNNKRK